MKAELELIAETYPAAKVEEFTKNPVADFIRHDAVESLKSEIGETESSLIVEGSPGKGRWADSPWIAFLDPLVTDTAQEGYYVTLLFSSSMDRVVLSLNQGITQFRKESSDQGAREHLRHSAALIRLRIPEFQRPPASFESDDIDLGATAVSSRAAFYEAGHAFGRTFPFPLPGDDVLLQDLRQMLALYRLLTFRGGINPEVQSPEQDEEARRAKDVETGLGVEDRRKYQLHRRIERNRNLARQAKKFHGFRCKVCGFDFAKRYGAIASEYIEAHHLTPLSELPVDRPTSLDPRTDFTVLCANCHRVAHMLGAPNDIIGLKGLLID